MGVQAHFGPRGGEEGERARGSQVMGVGSEERVKYPQCESQTALGIWHTQLNFFAQLRFQAAMDLSPQMRDLVCRGRGGVSVQGHPHSVPWVQQPP